LAFELALLVRRFAANCELSIWNENPGAAAEFADRESVRSASEVFSPPSRGPDPSLVFVSGQAHTRAPAEAVPSIATAGRTRRLKPPALAGERARSPTV